MTPLALALVAAAAIMHAAWNVLVKRAADELMFLWAAVGLGAVALAPVAIARLDVAELHWPILGTGLIHAVYFWALGRAYSFGDLSQVYPIARGLSVALVAVGGWLLLGETPSPLGAGGVALVLCGVLAVGIDRRAARAAVGYAVLTGVLIASYSLVDKHGVSRTDPIVYVCALGLGQALFLSPLAWRRRRALAVEWAERRGSLLLGATLSLAAYLLVLYAFSLSKTAYVVASRELSILASLALARFALGEAPSRRRVAGAVVIAAGVTVLAWAR